ncbi:hypothetical protein HWQ46_07110 [Shewanella sp. D64]|uniref:hypothetical protein n=1 Tax=unclassified Shewanella TaxID=196818 RepID=UPI0022BA1C3F|nr:MULTISPECIES: hypothetical protein [unclassified Shewanella]MEC4725312.1 hypothetical protein [Shewanella sp. D64]MEC4735842.1 hypothetical protein [Shewanella sp. E94]WBJ93187.1 hypothetical protein HWQ47_14610 [Shewanella sp. MTB7]
MNKNFDLQSALAALDEYGYDKKQSSDLAQARNKQQMSKYIESLDYNLRRLLILQETINELVVKKKHLIVQQENIQTYKTKVINLSRQFNISYDDVIQIMQDQAN